MISKTKRFLITNGAHRRIGDLTLNQPAEVQHPRPTGIPRYAVAVDHVEFRPAQSRFFIIIIAFTYYNNIVYGELLNVLVTRHRNVTYYIIYIW